MSKKRYLRPQMEIIGIKLHSLLQVTSLDRVTSLDSTDEFILSDEMDDDR